MFHRTFILIVIALTALVIGGCSTDKDAWVRDVGPGPGADDTLIAVVPISTSIEFTPGTAKSGEQVYVRVKNPGPHEFTGWLLYRLYSEADLKEAVIEDYLQIATIASPGDSIEPNVFKLDVDVAGDSSSIFVPVERSKLDVLAGTPGTYRLTAILVLQRPDGSGGIVRHTGGGSVIVRIE